MKKLDYLVIGAQKGGTTSAIRHLNQHPDIFIFGRELHFFDSQSFNGDYKKYHKNFPDDKIIGEKTPSYCYLQYAIDRIYEYNPDIKLVLFLRDPVKRAFSEWNMHRRMNMKQDFLESVKEIEDVPLSDIKKNGYWVLQRGLYIDHIEYILSKFKRENLYVGISEKIKKNPLEEYNNVFEFLGLPKLDYIGFTESINRSKYERPMTEDEKNYMKDKYRDKSKKLFDFLGYEIEEWDL
jgi:hypothetical protein|tara:strand:- start:823 stop:1533 length:711 start_codon:yes stop_codon:yes gene_type:complete